jgi:hypothetical protein
VARRVQIVPDLLVNYQVEGREWLVPAREVVDFDDLVEAERLVDIGQRELGGVDRGLLERREDLAARQHGDRGAEVLHHPSADASETNLESPQVVRGLDFVAEPASRLRSGHATEDGVHAVRTIDLLSQRIAAALIPPRRELPGLHAEGHSREQR